jgi:hypothetical protein
MHATDRNVPLDRENTQKQATSWVALRLHSTAFGGYVMRLHPSFVFPLILAACSSPADETATSNASDHGDAAAGDAAAATSDSGSLDASTSDASTSDGGIATGLPLGTLTVTNSMSTCPPHAAPGAACMTANVMCTGEPDIAVTIADVEPTGTPIGTVVAHDGGTGTGYYNGNTGTANAFSKSLTAKGYRYVQVAWAADWATTGKGIKQAGCRPATVFRWIFDNIHGGSKTAGFCGMGASGGTAAMLYSIASYGLKDVWDYLQLAAGPTPARIDYGCNPSSYTAGARNLCPQLTDAPWQYNHVATGSSSIVSIVNGWEGTSSCDNPSPPAADIATWSSDSLVSSSSDLNYPQTTMSFWYCVTDPNMSTGQGSFFVDQVHPKNSAEVNCYAGSCQDEEVFQDTTAFDLAVTDMTNNCVPNH